ncbi:MAG: hypothetical protein WBQ45_23785 [Roseiarcus sp.]
MNWVLYGITFFGFGGIYIRSGTQCPISADSGMLCYLNHNVLRCRHSNSPIVGVVGEVAATPVTQIGVAASHNSKSKIMNNFEMEQLLRQADLALKKHRTAKEWGAQKPK